MSFAYGGKDVHPFPVPVKVYDQSSPCSAVRSAKVGDTDKLEGFARLDRFVRGIEERHTPEANFHDIVAHEQRISPSLHGRTAFDQRKKAMPAQLRLF